MWSEACAIHWAVSIIGAKFLGGCSGINGIRGARLDYDDWNLQRWLGDEMFHYMFKVSMQAQNSTGRFGERTCSG